MKKIAGFLALLALTVTELALAAAVVTSTSGTVSAQVGSGAPRTVRVGDTLAQGDTVVTGPQSSAVMKFEDGQVAALGPNSRMTITTYQYDRASQRGSSLLSLITGAMRGITGMIGKNSPQNVAVRAATATIGIRGTDFTVITSAGKVYAEVNGGKISFTFGGKTVEVDTGRAVLAEADGKVTEGTIQQIYALLGSTAEGKEIVNALGNINALKDEINRVFPGTPTQGSGGDSGGASSGRNITPSGRGGSGTGGGGSASPS